MTPARKAALQWFHDRGEVERFDARSPSIEMRRAMVRDGQLQWRQPGNPLWSLTDKGRRDLHKAAP